MIFRPNEAKKPKIVLTLNKVPGTKTDKHKAIVRKG